MNNSTGLRPLDTAILKGNHDVALHLYRLEPGALSWDTSRALRVAVLVHAVELITEFADNSNIQVMQEPPQQEPARLNGSAVSIAIQRDYGDVLDALWPRLKSAPVEHVVKMLQLALSHRAHDCLELLETRIRYPWQLVAHSAVELDLGNVLRHILERGLVSGSRNFHVWINSLIATASRHGKGAALQALLAFRTN